MSKETLPMPKGRRFFHATMDLIEGFAEIGDIQGLVHQVTLLDYLALMVEEKLGNYMRIIMNAYEFDKDNAQLFKKDKD